MESLEKYLAKCPCGKGTVEISIPFSYYKMDLPSCKIQCVECSKKYRVMFYITKRYYTFGYNVDWCFFVPADKAIETKLQPQYPDLKPWNCARKDFAYFLALTFSQNDLNKIYDDLINKKRKDFQENTKYVVNRCYKSCETSSKNFILKEVLEALEKYGSYELNCEKLDAINLENENIAKLNNTICLNFGIKVKTENLCSPLLDEDLYFK